MTMAAPFQPSCCQTQMSAARARITTNSAKIRSVTFMLEKSSIFENPLVNQPIHIQCQVTFKAKKGSFFSCLFYCPVYLSIRTPSRTPRQQKQSHLWTIPTAYPVQLHEWIHAIEGSPPAKQQPQGEPSSQAAIGRFG